MKQVTNSQKTKRQERFRCANCGCTYVSDEYKIERISKTEIDIQDICPECNQDVLETIYR